MKKRIKPRSLDLYPDDVKAKAREAYIRFAFLDRYAGDNNRFSLAVRAGEHDGASMIELCAFMIGEGARTELKTNCGISEYFERQIDWSRETFGPALRTKGVIDHIRKELKEIEQSPHDLSEWVDVVILAMDGFWRHGGSAVELMPALLAKQQKNMARTWPDWRGMSEDSAIEHDRSKDRAENAL